MNLFIDDCNTQSCLQQTTKKSWCLCGAASFNHDVDYFGVPSLLLVGYDVEKEYKVLLSSIYFITEYVVRGLWSSLFHDKRMEYTLFKT
ncbi:hypothetical protein YC2023_071235 [Brassica napus]